MPFISAGDGDMKSAFVTDAWLIDQFVGNRLWVTGFNNNGQLGDNSVSSSSTLKQTVTGGTNWSYIFGGAYAFGGIKTDGTLWVWGWNDNGQLGDNTLANKSSPIQTITGGTNWKFADLGQRYCAGIKTDGTLWIWGNNAAGQLGDNTAVNKSSPIQTTTFGNNWIQVSCGYRHTGAIKTDGTLWMWGLGNYGQLGNNSTTSISSPVQTVTGGNNWKQVECGDYETYALKTDGTLWCWGSNSYGQLGDNTTTHRSSPVQTISIGTNWKQISERSSNVAAIKTDGTLWMWGINHAGQLGDNTTIRKSSPVQTIAGGSNWKQVSSAWYNTAAIKTDGTLWTWGYNANGELGDGTTTHRSSPIQTTLRGNNWKLASCGYRMTAAITYGD